MKNLSVKLGLAMAGTSVMLGFGVLPVYASTTSTTPVSSTSSVSTSSDDPVIISVPMHIVSTQSSSLSPISPGTLTAMSPDNTVTGDCGTAYMSIGNAGSGHANIVLGASSTEGAIIYESNSWFGTSPDGSISGSSSSAPFSGSFSKSYNETTGVGAVAAYGSITFETDEAATCTSEPLNGSAYIS
ncbi:hypothetical protein AAC03nite_39690 [Alicyclobacillus acidoterrestris]|nr:hypothetical protein AAC03nite_39690 [Alicyclobacillus acidoterrestris]